MARRVAAVLGLVTQPRISLERMEEPRMPASTVGFVLMLVTISTCLGSAVYRSRAATIVARTVGTAMSGSGHRRGQRCSPLEYHRRAEGLSAQRRKGLAVKGMTGVLRIAGPAAHCWSCCALLVLLPVIASSFDVLLDPVSFCVVWIHDGQRGAQMHSTLCRTSLLCPAIVAERFHSQVGLRVAEGGRSRERIVRGQAGNVPAYVTTLLGLETMRDDKVRKRNVCCGVAAGPFARQLHGAAGNVC